MKERYRRRISSRNSGSDCSGLGILNCEGKEKQSKGGWEGNDVARGVEWSSGQEEHIEQEI
mgnify:CR=1 FL=1